MSAYPPPPPLPPYDRQAMRAQRRWMKDQARLQRAQVRMQMRGSRRSSIVGPLVILSIGVVCLLAEIGKLSWGQSLDWFSRWWPAVLIAAGLILLAEWAIDQRRFDANGQANGQTYGNNMPSRSLGGGVVFLLIVIALAGLSANIAARSIAWSSDHFGSGIHNFDRLLGDRHDGYDTLSYPIGAGAGLIIRNPHGDVTVTGTSTDGQVHINLHTQAYAWKDSDAQAKAQRLRPVFSSEGKDLVMTVSAIEGGQADLTIDLPHTAAVTVQADHGDVNVSQIHAAVTLSANHGDVDLSAIDGSVSAHVNSDSASFTAHSITGDLTIAGHNGDVEVSEVAGAVTLRGDFFGNTHLQHVQGHFAFESTRTHFEAQRIDGDFSVGSDSLDASELMGPVVLKTHDKNITLDRIQGGVSVANRNGSVSITNAPPLSPIDIQNAHGSVDLGIPPGAGFVLNAQTRRGDLENDFGINTQTNDKTLTIKGQVGSGGPSVFVVTTDGDVTIRKSTVAPLPPVPPAPPRITSAPTPPASPKAPKAPKPPTPPPPAQPAAPKNGSSISER